MANYLMMVKVSAYRLKYIHPQIYNFHLEEATFLSNSQGHPIAVNEDFHILQTRKYIKFPVPLIHDKDFYSSFKKNSGKPKRVRFKGLNNMVIFVLYK